MFRGMQHVSNCCWILQYYCKPQARFCRDLDLSGSRDVIGHVISQARPAFSLFKRPIAHCAWVVTFVLRNLVVGVKNNYIFGIPNHVCLFTIGYSFYCALMKIGDRYKMKIL